MTRRRTLTLCALSGWLGYQLRAWNECEGWVKTGRGMVCRGKA